MIPPDAQIEDVLRAAGDAARTTFLAGSRSPWCAAVQYCWDRGWITISPEGPGQALIRVGITPAGWAGVARRPVHIPGRTA